MSKTATDPVETFRLEAGDLLEQIEEIALGLEQAPGDTEAINRMFRAFHTLKGSGAMFGFDELAAFTHHVETALDKVRNGQLAVDPDLLRLLLAARDQIQVLLNGQGGADCARECGRIISELAAISGGTPAAAPGASVARPPPTGERAAWRILFKPAAGIGARGLDPLSLLDELRSLGSCEVEADTAPVPAIAQLQPEACALAWRITLCTDRGQNAIKDVFIFVEDDAQVSIEPSPAAPARTPTAGTPKADPAPGRQKAPAADSTVRVPSAKLDRLVGLVGELVMNQSRLAQISARIRNADLDAPVEAIERLVDELRDSVLGIRMMPIGATFSRFKRLVHDLSHELGKEIDLVTEGAETEMDKTVLDQLGDPLIHLIRNSVDHGIDAPEERIAGGKPRRGTVRLTARHEGSSVVVSIQDDGRGLDVEAIRAKALEKGLIAPDSSLSDKEIFNLIFLPGFSTAKEVTSISGRGVGMDVVRRQIDALHGSISLASKRGAGTTVSLSLPLTLAIVDGLLVEIGRDQYILPMAAVTETVELHGAERAQQNGRNLIAVRGELVPYIRLRELFQADGREPAIEKIVIARHDGQRVGIVVDRVLGSHQTVIQPLGRLYGRIEVASGATIMGDGRVALILDLAGIVRADAGAPLR